MLEIRRGDDCWEAWMSGRIFDWNDNLETLLKDLHKKAEEIAEEILED